MIKILLPNRDGDMNVLEQISDDKYKLTLQKELPIGVTGTLDNIIAVDPSGGPYISVGYEVCSNIAVRKIEHIEGEGFVFTIN